MTIDGSKFKAVNSKGRNFTKDKLKELLARIEERIEAYLKELDRSDEQDDGGTPGGAHAEHLQAKIEALTQRQLLYEGFQGQLEASGQGQLSASRPAESFHETGQRTRYGGLL